MLVLMEQESWASNPGVRKSMQANRSKDTSPELALRKLLHAQGLRYRVNSRPFKQLRRTADVVFSKAKVAVFVDGCFWHACPEHYTEPIKNVDYWRTKISRNLERDAEINQRLADEGWKVLRFWSHVDPEVAAGVVLAVVKKRSPSSESR